MPNRKMISEICKRILGLVVCLLLLSSACSTSRTKMGDAAKSNGDGPANSEASENSSSALVESSEIYSLGESEADIFWRTSEPITTSLSYGRDKDSLKTVTSGKQQKSHYFRLKDLKPETAYYFRIEGVKDAETRSFVTLARPGGKYLFSFVVATDIHLTNSKLDQFGALYKESYDIFDSLINEVNKEKVDFLVVKGDISHNSEPRDYQVFTQGVSRLKCKIYAVPGNHDKQQAGWALFFKPFSPNTSSYFSLDHKKWHFVFLDSASEEFDRGYLNSTELSWLSKDLQANSQTPTMIFMHHLVHESLISQAKRFFVQNAEQFMKTIEPYPVIAVHSGHAHLNSAEPFGNTDFIVTGAVINYPVQYNVYHVYEKGYVQVCHRLPSFIEQSEESKKALSTVYSTYFGVRPELASSLVEGRLENRSFVRKIK